MIIMSTQLCGFGFYLCQTTHPAIASGGHVNGRCTTLVETTDVHVSFCFVLGVTFPIAPHNGLAILSLKLCAAGMLE